MSERGYGLRRWRGAALVAGAALAGATLITPAMAAVTVADATEEMRHIWRHFIKKQVVKLGDLRWLGITAKAADADSLDGVDSTGFYKTGSTVADSQALDGLDSTAFQRPCQDGTVKAFAIINGNHADLVATAFQAQAGGGGGGGGGFVSTPVVRSYNCNGAGVSVRRTPSTDGGAGRGDYQVAFGYSTDDVFAGCPTQAVQLTPGPNGGAGYTHTTYVRTVGYLNDFFTVDCYVEVEVRNYAGIYENDVFTIAVY